MILATTNGAATINGPQVFAAMLMLVGVVMLGFVLMISIRGKIQRRNAQIPTARERMAEIRSAASDREDIYSMEADLLDTGRRLIAQLEARAAALEHLLTLADARIERLERLSQSGTAAEPTAPGPPEAVETGVEPSPGPRIDLDPGHDVDPDPDPDPEPVVARRVPSPHDPDVVDDLTAAVYALADQGRSSVEIARELDEQTGKIELILALREGAA